MFYTEGWHDYSRLYHIIVVPCTIQYSIAWFFILMAKNVRTILLNSHFWSDRPYYYYLLFTGSDVLQSMKYLDEIIQLKVVFTKHRRILGCHDKAKGNGGEEGQVYH